MFGDPRLPERFWSRVRVTDSGCWEWQASKRAGYGAYCHNGRQSGAHRVAYIELVGPLTSGKQIDHLCRNPACVNPSHMEPVTSKENTLRGVSPPALQAKREACPQGHPYDQSNTYRHDGKRRCKVCHRKQECERKRRLRGDHLKEGE